MIAREEDVLGLEIAMEDAARVRVGHRVDRGDEEIDRLLRLDPAAAPVHVAPEVLPLEELLDDEGGPVLGLADVEDVNHVRVADDVGGARLAEEAHDHLGALAVLFAQQLDRHVPAEPGVLGTVDFAHAPRAEQRVEPVLAGEDLPRARVSPRLRHRLYEGNSSTLRSVGYARRGQSPAITP